MQSTIKERTHQIDARHTLHQAVRQEYPLSCICKKVRLIGRGFELWEQSDEETKISFRDRNLYFQIDRGDTVEIVLPSPNEELPPGGPRVHSLDPVKRCASETVYPSDVGTWSASKSPGTLWPPSQLLEMRACLDVW